ncbi:DNA/RNA nuclease SfsA [Treponema berlinense]|uniref:DNA/RNA nuclease SfsA n=1 Tax=Treponema berlinense TaxID=225004 RepID=UPI002356A02E|nr:DNA/RNA nuclease SfsA [Treponema berlinense]
MEYEKIVSGTFIDRPNRFIAHVNIQGQTETVHVKNTGRCRELLVSGCQVILEDFRGRKEAKTRKTQFDLIAVYKKIHKTNPLFKDNGLLLINMDSQAPNKVAKEYLLTQDYDIIKPEFTYGNSRVDFYMEKGNRKFLMEIKGCTLEENGKGLFPDAPTERGVKHLKELTTAIDEGFECILGFVIQIPGVKEVAANIKTHPEFAQALKEAKQKGVKILFLETAVNENSLKILKATQEM